MRHAQTPGYGIDVFSIKVRNMLHTGCPNNKPKGLKVAKEELRSIGSMVNGLDGRQDPLIG